MSSRAPSKLHFNNVVSMGISYSWDSDTNNVAACTGLNHGSNDFVKRSKSISLEVANLDLNNAGGSTIAKMASNQDKYVSTNKTRVYANGLYAGEGKLVDYSINEGSLSNESITNLTYELSNEIEGIDQKEDPVQRDESITVSRNLQSKSYTIEHSYSVTFGDDDNLISDHPLYKDNPSYSSVDGRLALGEQEANLAIYENPINYNEYIDLSPYVSEKGWDLERLENGCSGVSSNSSETKNYINGDYSLSKTTNLQYTGEDLKDELDLYEVNYTMSWSQEERGSANELCSVVTMNGTIRGIAKNCGPEANASMYAESGYNKFINEGEAKDRVSGFFVYIKDNISGVPTGELNDAIFDLKKQECNPSVDRDGTQNNGEIEFSFNMHNCPNYDVGTSSNQSNTSSVDVSYSDCDNVRVSVTTSSRATSVQAGECFLAIDESGKYPKYESISGKIDFQALKDDASGAYTGQYDERLALASEEFSYSPYQGSESYTVTWSDASKDGNCVPVSKGCGVPNVKSKVSPAKPVYKDIQTAKTCGEYEIASWTPSKKTVNISLDYPKTCPATTLHDLVGTLLSELNANAPQCAIESMSWSASMDKDGNYSLSAQMAGIENTDIGE